MEDDRLVELCLAINASLQHMNTRISELERLIKDMQQEKIGEPVSGYQ